MTAKTSISETAQVRRGRSCWLVWTGWVQALDQMVQLLPSGLIPMKGLGELDVARMINDWGMPEDAEVCALHACYP